MRQFLLLAFALVALGAAAFRVDSAKVATRYLATPEDITVIIPDAAANGKRVPTVYVLNGFGGDHKTWISKVPAIGEMADRYEVVLVMPDGRDSWYWDSPVDTGMQMESFFANDLVPYVDAHYPTLPQRESRAITGLSMGGHGALWLAMNHPGLWCAAGSMSGGVDIRPFPKSWKMEQRLGKARDADPALWESHTVAANIDKLKDANLAITVECGADDFFAGVNNALHDALLKEGIAHDYTSRPGKHTWEYWGNALPYHLLFFNSKMAR